MMRSRLIPALVALLGLLPGLASAAPRGVALVVGIGTYDDKPLLPVCIRAAHAVSAHLRASGFEVDELTDPSGIVLRTAVGDFADAVLSRSPSAPALVYVCARAATLDHRVFLLPADATAEAMLRLQTEGIVLRALMNTFTGSNAMLVADLGMSANAADIAATAKDRPDALQVALLAGAGDRLGAFGERLAATKLDAASTGGGPGTFWNGFAAELRTAVEAGPGVAVAVAPGPALTPTSQPSPPPAPTSQPSPTVALTAQPSAPPAPQPGPTVALRHNNIPAAPLPPGITAAPLPPLAASAPAAPGPAAPPPATTAAPATIAAAAAPPVPAPAPPQPAPAPPLPTPAPAQEMANATPNNPPPPAEHPAPVAKPAPPPPERLASASQALPRPPNRNAPAHADSRTSRIQDALARRGFYRGPADGVPTPRTASAIRAFQASLGDSPTGALTQVEIVKLLNVW